MSGHTYEGVSTDSLYIIVRDAAGAEASRIGFNSTVQLIGIMPMADHLLPGFWFDYSACQAAVDDIEQCKERLAEETRRKRKKRGGQQWTELNTS